MTYIFISTIAAILLSLVNEVGETYCFYPVSSSSYSTMNLSTHFFRNCSSNPYQTS